MPIFKSIGPLDSALEGLQWSGPLEVEANWKGKKITLHLNYDGMMVMQMVGKDRMLEILSDDAKRFLVDEVEEGQ